MRFVPYENLRDYGITASKVTIWRLERDGKFPKRVQVSPGRHAWLEDEIRKHITGLVAARDSVEAA